MNAVILNGAAVDDTTGSRLQTALTEALAERGWAAKPFILRENKIGACAGDFFCWIREPGVCNVDDDNRIIAAAIANADLLIYLTPVTFGGYSSNLKQMVDHQIQNISPFFKRIDGEVHHQKRYERYPDFLAVGWQATPDEAEAAVFHHLVSRNALNFHAETTVSAVVTAGLDEAAARAAAAGWLADIGDGRSSAAPPLPAAIAQPGGRPERALLLVGSPRTRKSSSYALGDYLLEQLAAGGVETETIFAHTTVRSAARREALLAAVDAADLIVLAFPLYVDSLPAPLIEALELIAAHRRDNPDARPRRLVAIANCGFPEAHHNDTALAIAAAFGRQCGAAWAGGLALGAGEGLVRGVPLADLGGQGAGIRRALELAAAALLAGDPVPAEAAAIMARPLIPVWMYTLMGGVGWRRQARQYSAHRALRRRPYVK